MTDLVSATLWITALAAIAAGGMYVFSARTLAPAERASLGKGVIGKFLIGVSDGLAAEEKRESATHVRSFRILGALAVLVGLALIWMQLTGVLIAR